MKSRDGDVNEKVAVVQLQQRLVSKEAESSVNRYLQEQLHRDDNDVKESRSLESEIIALEMESMAAHESLESHLYITWLPLPTSSIPASACLEVADGTGQCCRISSLSLCRCGHALSQHNQVKATPGYC